MRCSVRASCWLFCLHSRAATATAVRRHIALGRDVASESIGVRGHARPIKSNRCEKQQHQTRRTQLSAGNRAHAREGTHPVERQTKSSHTHARVQSSDEKVHTVAAPRLALFAHMRQACRRYVFVRPNIDNRCHALCRGSLRCHTHVPGAPHTLPLWRLVPRQLRERLRIDVDVAS